jgi:hypothetical protein
VSIDQTWLDRNAAGGRSSTHAEVHLRWLRDQVEEFRAATRTSSHSSRPIPRSRRLSGCTSGSKVGSAPNGLKHRFLRPRAGGDSCRGSTGTSRNGRFAETPEAKVRGYQPGRFSFNLGVRHGFEVSHVVTVQARSYSSWRRCGAESHGPSSRPFCRWRRIRSSPSGTRNGCETAVKQELRPDHVYRWLRYPAQL